MPRSAIEMMVDKACGYDPVRDLKPRVPVCLIRCPKCSRQKECHHDRADPKGTKLVVFTCPDCPKDDGAPRYFDKDGKELFR